MKQLARREAIFALEDAMRKLPQIKEELHHHFAKGLYAREMRIPKGTIIVGKIHRFPCLNFVMSGIVEVRSDKGAKRYKAPAIFESGAGTKRAMVAIKALTWVTVHSSDETDLDRLEDQIIDDHSAFLHEYGLTEQDAQDVMDVEWIKVDESYSLQESSIHGVGVFAELKKGDRLTAMKNGIKTEVGRFTNHSAFPNVSIIRDGEDVFFVAEKAIDGEITVNYRNVVNAMVKT